MIVPYNISIIFYRLAVGLASLFNEKARKFIRGRRNLLSSIQQDVKGHTGIIWFHCASLGEFEQARPVIEALRARKKDVPILLTFFSPSGYEIRKNYDKVNWVHYLPLDTSRNARRFLEIVNPQMAVFTKYDFWYHYLTNLKQNNVPTYIFSAIFRKEQPFFKWYGSLFRTMLGCFEMIMVQDPDSVDLLDSIGIKNVLVAGDTRFDRVIVNAAYPAPLPKIEVFKDDKTLIIIGSAWKEDLQIILPALQKAQQAPGTSEFKVLIAPHELHQKELEWYRKTFSEFTTFYSEWNSKVDQDKFLILDTMGMLSSVYSEADIAWIGGGFGKGIHNTLEAAVYGIPVLFGPNYQKFKEARDLIERKGAISVQNEQEAFEILEFLLREPLARKGTGEIAKNYVFSQKGSTDKVINTIFAGKLESPNGAQTNK